MIFGGENFLLRNPPQNRPIRYEKWMNLISSRATFQTFTRTKEPFCTCLHFRIWLFRTVHAAGQYLKVEYPASTNSDELQLAVTYTLWIPDGRENGSRVIVHQHGAGIAAAKSGASAAYDLHWQALAKNGTAPARTLLSLLTEKRTTRPAERSSGLITPWIGKNFLRALKDFSANPAIPRSKPCVGFVGTFRRRHLS